MRDKSYLDSLRNIYNGNCIKIYTIINSDTQILFDQPEFIDINEIGKTVPFEWKEDELEVKLVFHIENGTAISLPKVPYAGMSIIWGLSNTDTSYDDDWLSTFLSKNLPYSVVGEIHVETPTENAVDRYHKIKNMLFHLDLFLAGHSVKHIIIKQGPTLQHTVRTEILHHCMIQHGYSAKTEINHTVDLKSFKNLAIHPMQRRRIKKCKNHQFTIHRVTNNIGEVYDFLADCRQQQGLTINIAKEKLLRLIRTFPKQYEVYAVYNSQIDIIAATVIVILNQHIAYNYLPGFDRAYHQFSPLSYLQYKLYDFLNQRLFTTFDLGISSVDGKKQEGLCKFKERMGAKEGVRYTYQLKLKKG